VRAKKEIVLSAGSIETPKLLMLSGIGDAATLKQHGITPVVNLPGVGQNLHDHILGAGCNWESKGPVPPSNYNASEVYMWERTDSRLPAPDINVLYVSLPFSTPQLPMPKVDGYSILSGVQRPQSRGSLTLASANPNDAPIIDPNYLAVDDDWTAFRKATELAREIGNSKSYDPYRKREILPGNGVSSQAEWRDFLAKSAWTFFHPVGTAKMGVDEMAVVDPQLRVYGVQGLRVADASIMPSITSGNPNAPTIMIGWRAAGFLAASA
jgi:choline dehydrogenase